MTAEELKRLLALGDAGYSEAWFELEDMAPTLARKVIAAEKLAEALRNEVSRGRRHLAKSTLEALAAWEQSQ